MLSSEKCNVTNHGFAQQPPYNLRENTHFKGFFIPYWKLSEIKQILLSVLGTLSKENIPQASFII